MATIDELMEDKVPGSVRVTCPHLQGWFQPYFKNKASTWFGPNELDYGVSYSSYFSCDWEIYENRKPTNKKVYEWMAKPDKWWIVSRRLMTEEEALDSFTQNLGAVMPHKKTGREFEVEA